MKALELVDKLNKAMESGDICVESEVLFLPRFGAITEGNQIEDIMVCHILINGEERVYLCEKSLGFNE